MHLWQQRRLFSFQVFTLSFIADQFSVLKKDNILLKSFFLEKAFYDPSVLELLYFPDDQK